MSGATIPGALNTGANTQYWDGTAWVTTVIPDTNQAFYGSSGANSTTLGAQNDFANGRGGNDVISGGNGNDVLVGGTGNDNLIGGAGADTLVGADASVTGSLTTGNVSVTVTGGGASPDTLSGGTGDDTYIVTGSGVNSAANDQVVELSGQGTDTVLLDSSTANAYTAPVTAAVENIGVLNPNVTTGVSLAAAGSGAHSISGGAGNDSMSGGVGNDTLTGGVGNDTLNGGADNDLLIGNGGESLAGGDGNDTFRLSGGNSTVDGGGGTTDTLTFSTSGTYTITGGPGSFTVTGPGAEANSVSNVEFLQTNTGNVAFGAGSFYVCFATGTRILTADGEVAVEKLRAGDLVATLAGRGSPMKPVLWVGRRHVVLAGHPQAGSIAPVRVRAGALGPNAPHRDLLVSPDHCLFLDGALVPARLLVDGENIVVERGLAEVTYFHVELESHDVLLADGAAAESWLDCANRGWFENAPVAQLSVSGTLAEAGTGWDASRACAPLVHGGEQLAAIRAAIAARAATAAAPGRAVA